MIENDDRIGHVIENPDGERDLVTPTNELFAETRKLEILFQKHNCLWKKASFTITWNHESEDWSFSADYEYSS
ncbi:MAG: hypothetical protein H8D23_00090 [Candidatus Brocadiales bacterium]|nr:hypothetical protein [Candidatus Brocadiales bacterium]